MTPRIPALPSWHHFKPVLGGLYCLLLIFALRAKIGPELREGNVPRATMTSAPHLPVVHLVDPAAAPRDGILPPIGNPTHPAP